MADELCTICNNKVEVQIMKNTGVCGEKCRKLRDGDKRHPIAYTDAGITNIIAQPEGVNPSGII